MFVFEGIKMQGQRHNWYNKGGGEDVWPSCEVEVWKAQYTITGTNMYDAFIHTCIFTYTWTFVTELCTSPV